MQHFGLLNIDKPAGWTSRAVVNCTQRLVHPAKVGHAGTLDPLATGVLVVCIGPATRLVESIQRMPKRYLATFLLGRWSETEDTEGNVSLLKNPPRPSRAEIETVAQSFVGFIDQMPPRYSAIQMGGQRAYQLARAGKPIHLRSRQVRIDSIQCIEYHYPSMTLDITCGGGTYIRSIGRDLAKSLETMAVMSALRRLAVGKFLANEAISPSSLLPEALPQWIRPPIEAVPDLPRRLVTQGEMVLLANGQPIPGSDPPLECLNQASGSHPGEWAAVDKTNRLLAILKERDDGRLWPKRNFLHVRAG
ncbi:MAG: tRNA pseudouridine(55) synthase TruB [Pirellulales bacterium]|nr:tRNA pseudouridine(55) synthase TruB [Pirellulales bacterium]